MFSFFEVLQFYSVPVHDFFTASGNAPHFMLATMSRRISAVSMPLVGLLLAVLSAERAAAFYLPGVNPQSFSDGDP